MEVPQDAVVAGPALAKVCAVEVGQAAPVEPPAPMASRGRAVAGPPVRVRVPGGEGHPIVNPVARGYRCALHGVWTALVLVK